MDSQLFPLSYSLISAYKLDQLAQPKKKNPILIPHITDYYTLFLAFNQASREWFTLSISTSLPPMCSLNLVPSYLSPKSLLKILSPK